MNKRDMEYNMKKRQKENLYYFYIGKEPDLYGRWFDDILCKNSLWLESAHNYIQRLFPLTDPSNYDKTAPVLDENMLLKMQGDQVVRVNMVRALCVMLDFYGLQLHREGQSCTIAEKNKVHHWINPYNHNYKRITRILKSLRLMKLDAEANAFFECLSFLYDRYSLLIGQETYSYWKEAMM